MAKRANPKPIGANLCSLCEQIDVTFGEQKQGGIRYCLDCLKTTLSWVQMTAAQHDLITALMVSVKAQPRIQTLLNKYADVPEDLRHAASIGESTRRLAESGQ